MPEKIVTEFVFSMPLETAMRFHELLSLHPGEEPSVVMARALTIYHFLYRDYLDGKCCEHMDKIFKYLNMLVGAHLRGEDIQQYGPEDSSRTDS